MIVVDADNGGRIGPIGFIGLGFVAAFYTAAAADAVAPTTIDRIDFTATIIDSIRWKRKADRTDFDVVAIDEVDF